MSYSKKPSIVCGIDEAGRGPVIGPLILCGVCFEESQLELLKKYCDLRIKSIELMAKSIEKDTRHYDLRISNYHEKIGLILKKLKGEDVPDSLINNIYTYDNLEENAKVLLILNGEPINSLDHIDSSTIERIDILKDSSAVKIYDERGKDGVVLIQTN